MSDFLNNLAAKSLGLARSVQPRSRSLFEPVAARTNLPDQLSLDLSLETDALPERQSRGHAPVETSPESISILTRPAQIDSNISVINPSFDLRAKDVVKDAANSHRAEPERNRASDADASKPSTDSIKPPGQIINYKTVVEAPVVDAKRADDTQPQNDEREGRASFEREIRRILAEQINRSESKTQSTEPPVETNHTNWMASQSRTVMPVEGKPSIKPPVAQTPAPARAEPQPEIRITIGRVDVRAVMSAPSPAPARPAPAPASLDDYLKERSGGRR